MKTVGIVTISGTNIQYFSLSEEIIAIATLFFDFILNLAPGWLLFITAISVFLIILGVYVRIKTEVTERW